MMNVMWMAVAAALLFVPARQGVDEALTVRAIRFFSPASATTTIEGVCEVRLPALLRGVGQASRYRVQVAVLDSAGLELQHSEWMRDIPAPLAHAAGATMVESFAFNAAPGRYRVRIRVTPSAGEAAERETAIIAFDRAPAISDLLVSSGVRQPATDTEIAGPGEVRRAGLLMRTAPAPRLTPGDPSISWYAEMYPRAAVGSGQLDASVLAQDGHVVVRTPARPITIAAAGSVTQGSLDLAGLPEGAYRLRLQIRLPDTMLVAEAPFMMSPLVTTPVAIAVTAPAAPSDLFAEADETRLDSLFGPLVYVAESSRDLGVYRTLTTEGKRRFLREFWARRDPTPATPDNIARDTFYRGVAHANQAFREGGTGDIPGWNTDRGRIYLRNGRPDEMLVKRAGSPRPYEAWKFTRERNRWYVFQDQTGLGHYILIATSDRRESGRQGWKRILGADGTRDVYQFLNLDMRDLHDLDVNP